MSPQPVSTKLLSRDELLALVTYIEAPTWWLTRLTSWFGSPEWASYLLARRVRWKVNTLLAFARRHEELKHTGILPRS